MRSVNLPGDPAFARFGFDAARASDGLVLTSGQIGNLDGDMPAQLAGALDAVAAILAAANCSLEHVVRLGIFSTDVDELIAHWAVIRERFAPGSVPPNTLVQVARLASPRALVEIDATAIP